MSRRLTAGLLLVVSVNLVVAGIVIGRPKVADGPKPLPDVRPAL